MLWVKLGEVILLIGMVFLLVKSTEMLIGVLRHLAKFGGVGKFGLTAFLLALATSLPELVVGIVSALEGDPTIALGNVLGSNIADLSIVIGGVALFGGGIVVKGKFIQRDLFLSFLAGSLPLLMLIDGRLTRWDGLVLLMVYVVYVIAVLGERERKLGEEELEMVGSQGKIYQDMAKFWVGVLGLLVSAHLIVKLAERVAF